MKKAWLLPPQEDWIVDRFCSEWHSDNPDMSTLNPRECDVIWLIADWCWRRVPLGLLQSKRVLTTVHHMVPEKMDRAAYDDFAARDHFTHAYHVPNVHTAQQLRAIVGTKKPVYVIPYWCNPKIWYPENKSEMREKHEIPQSAYAIGSFQRDTEGHDLRTPKLEKGPDLVADYIESLARDDTFVVLAGWRRQYIISRLEHAGIRYKYFEKPDQSTLRELYATLDLYPIGARYEGGPQALTECGLMGIPCVSRPVGIAEVVLPQESISHDLKLTKPAVPNISRQSIPYGYKAFRQVIDVV